MRSVMRAGTWIAVWYAAVLTACVATPLPDPPDLAPPDREGIAAMVVQNLVMDSVTTLEGEPGSGRPGAVLHVVRLATDEPPHLAIVQEDGSFSLVFPAATGVPLRLSY